MPRVGRNLWIFEQEGEGVYVSDPITLGQFLQGWVGQEAPWTLQAPQIALGGEGGALTHARYRDLWGLKALERIFLDFRPFRGVLKDTRPPEQTLEIRAAHIPLFLKRVRQARRVMEQGGWKLDTSFRVDESHADPVVLMEDPDLEALVALSRRRTRPLTLQDILDLIGKPDAEILLQILPHWIRMGVLLPEGARQGGEHGTHSLDSGG